jgi:hypothetical protein
MCHVCMHLSTYVRSVLHEVTRVYEKLSLNVEIYPAIIKEEEKN